MRRLLRRRRTRRSQRGRGHSVSGQQEVGTNESQPDPATPPASSSASAPLEKPSASTPKSNKRRKRGKTRLEYLWNVAVDPLAPKKHVEMNDRGQPVGDVARKLGQFLGTMVRKPQFFTFTYDDWRLVPHEKKETVWHVVQDVFDVDITLKDWVLESFHKKWKDYKCYLKRTHYNAFKDDPEAAKRNCPSNIGPIEWEWLVQFWESDASKKREGKNKANRAKQKMPHTAGTKSFARIYREEAIKNNGVEPSRTEMFCLTRTRKNGTPVDSDAAKLIAKMQKMESKQQKGSQSKTAKDDIFSQVLGKNERGHVRMMGLGVRPTILWGPQPTRLELLKEVVYARRNAAESAALVERAQQDAAEAAALAERARQDAAEARAQISSIHQSMAALASFVSKHCGGEPIDMDAILQGVSSQGPFGYVQSALDGSSDPA